MKDLTKGNIYKTFVTFGVPLMLAGILSQLYSFVDTAMVGKFLGVKALAAVSVFDSVTTFLNSIFWGFSMGIGIYVGRLYGQKNYEKIRCSICSIIFFYSLCAIIISLVCIFGHPILENILKVDSVIRAESKEYFLIYMSGFVFFTLTVLMSITFNAFGASAMPFFGTLISTVLNIGGNALSIFVFKWGVKGVAISSVFAAAVLIVFYAINLKITFNKMGLKNTKIKIEFSIMKNIVGYSLPCIIQQMIIYVVLVVVSPRVNQLGYEASASFSVIRKMMTLCESIYVNLSKTVSNYLLQSIGGGKFENVKKGFFVGLMQSVGFVLPLLILLIIFPNIICEIFFDESATAVAKGYVISYARTCLPFALFAVCANVFHNFFRGVTAMKLLICSTTVYSIMFLIIALICMPIMQMNGLFLAWIVGWISEALFCIIILRTSLWKPKEMREWEQNKIRKTA